MNYKLIFLLLITIKISKCTRYLLPDALTPETYDIKLLSTLNQEEPNDFTFQGEINIQVICNNETTEITLHAHMLQIIDKDLRITNIKSNNTIKVLKSDLDRKYDFLTIHLETPLLESETYNIHISYNGVINKNLAGFYRSSYKNDNDTTWLALTQFEPTYARYAFPCFDEPAYKAKFKISLGHDKNLNSISNMPLEKTVSLNESYVLDVYQETVPMSTYLVAFIISDFEFISSPFGLSKTEFKIWSRKDALPQAAFASTTGPKALSFFETYFDIPYPLPKQDMVAIPDFSAGAMENWGLITYRETALLFDPKVSTLDNQKGIAYVICHELAHQWFGNLVTMKWWNDLWLNEGFATYMGTICVENLFPEWKYETEDFLHFMDIVYYEDSLMASIPLSNEVKDPSMIGELFGAIAYKKGALVIRMIQKSLGENVLRKGVTAYLKEHSYKNAEQDDLWHALTKSAHEHDVISNDTSVKQIMDSWTLQTGYPIVTVERDYKTGVITFSQRRYLQNSDSTPKQKECWWIPLSYTTTDELAFNNTEPRLWLSCPERNVSINYDNAEGWIIFNIQRSGIYRVNYDARNWDLIANHLRTKNFDDITEINRYALIDDIMSLADLGDIDYSKALSFLRYLKNETEYNPWSLALRKLSSISKRLHRSKVHDVMKSYMQTILKPQYKKIGGLTDFKNITQMQKLFVSKACAYEVEECLDDAKNQFKAYITDPENNLIQKEFVQIVLCNGLKSSGEKEWNFLWNKYLKSNIGTEKNALLKVLACTKQKDILEKYINLTLNENSGIRKQDFVSVFSAIASHKEGYEIAKSFFYRHGPELLEFLLPSGRKFGGIIHVIAKPIVNDNEYEMLKNYIDKYPQFTEHANLRISQALESIQSNIRWYTKYNGELTNTLRIQSKEWSDSE